MAMMPLGACGSLHSLVQGAETHLSSAIAVCNTLRACREVDHPCAALVQLDQALQDGKEYIQREYDHIINTYGNKCASEGDRASRITLWMICNNIDDRITKPLVNIEQQIMLHQGHHDHGHGHHDHHQHHHDHDHHHCHCHHHSSHVLGFVIGCRIQSHHGGGHHSQVAENEAKMQEMLGSWNRIKDNISCCFDELENQLKKKKENGDDDGGNDSNAKKLNKKKIKSVAEVVNEMMDATNTVDEELRMISNVDDRIRIMGKRPRSPSCSSDSIESIHVDCRGTVFNR